MLTDAQWAMLEPLVEQCRPKGKTPPHDLRRTLDAILWRHENGAKWRAVLTELGPWWRAASDLHPLGSPGCLGTPAQPGAGARDPARNDVPRRHQRAGSSEGRPSAPKRGSQAQRDDREALGRSRGGYCTKACVIADSRGRAIAFRIAPGQAHELPDAIPLLDSLPGVPTWVVADRGYSSHSFREHIWSIGAKPAIPAKSNEAPVACPDWIYNNRNVVERLWARLKEWRAVATRYEKTASSFMGVLCLAAAIDWLKH
ncbi:IS5 family transposase [Microvirga sp. Mcv34]|uniref:IS5 family transposase n=1 Tax=Microvirga sp. Mcv34 TaxID=2926016 RepID=UPI0021C5D7F8|nr:IS5 family transposase [Microvirga sp. Mcv34]